MQTCNKCNKEKSLEAFEKSSKNSYRKTCKQCRNRATHLRKKETGAYDRRRKKQNAKRHDPALRAYWVYHDSKYADQKNNLENDLTIELIDELISTGCAYCKLPFENSAKIKIGIDRIDHNLPHNKDNVKPCCSRCNFIRRTLPYQAWEILIPSIHQIVNEGLLDEWEWGFKHHFHNR
jgi:hypothetical protein